VILVNDISFSSIVGIVEIKIFYQNYLGNQYNKNTKKKNKNMDG
jgi:hypothetical protein